MLSFIDHTIHYVDDGTVDEGTVDDGTVDEGTVDEGIVDHISCFTHTSATHTIIIQSVIISCYHGNMKHCHGNSMALDTRTPSSVILASPSERLCL